VIDPRLAGRVALVTGANQGIGAAVAVALAAQGARVFLTYLRLDPARHGADAAYPTAYGDLRAGTADQVVEAIRRDGGTAEAAEADLADPATPAGLLDRVEASLGPVEILVNNASGWLADTFLADPAAGGPDGPGGAMSDRFGRVLRRVDADGHDRQFAVDARAAALLIAEFARRHVARGATWGRIIGLTSGGPGGFPEEVSYGAAKAAQENYTMSAAQELGRFGVTANMVHPPATDTGWVTPAVEEAVVAASPLRHVGRPEQVAEVVTFPRLAPGPVRHRPAHPHVLTRFPLSVYCGQSIVDGAGQAQGRRVGAGVGRMSDGPGLPDGRRMALTGYPVPGVGRRSDV
jgi:3-oxoacyl-[acyl-carrier protein] reductase